MECYNQIVPFHFKNSKCSECKENYSLFLSEEYLFLAWATLRLSRAIRKNWRSFAIKLKILVPDLSYCILYTMDI